MQKAEAILSLLSQKAQARPKFRFDRLYRHLYHPGFYRWVNAKTSGQPIAERQVMKVIEQLRWERYRFGKDRAADSLVVGAVTALLSSLYANELAETSWKPVVRQREALFDLRFMEMQTWVLSGTLTFEDETLRSPFEARIADGRLLRLVVHLLASDQSSALFRLWLHLLIWQWQKNGRLPATKWRLLYEQQKVLVLMHGASEKVATAWKQTMDRQMGKTEWNLIDASRRRFYFAGWEIRPASSSARVHYHLLIPRQRMYEWMRPYMRHGKPAACNAYLHLPVEQIIALYRQKMRAFQRVYDQADNWYRRRKHLGYVLRKSLTYTLAKKLKRSPKQIRNEYEPQLKGLTQR